MARQPNGATSCAVAMPAPIAPSEMPLPTNITISARRLCGAYSEASPIAFGNAAPSPRPVKNRSTINGTNESTAGVSSVSDAEGDARVDDDFAPPDSIGERREQHRAEHDADEAAGEGRPQLAANEPPFLRDRRRDVGDALHVEAVDEQHGRAQQEDAQLERADGPRVDDVRNVDGSSHSLTARLTGGLTKVRES